VSEPLTPTDQTQPGTVTGPLVTAIERTWAAIQARHPDVPDVVLTLGNGSTRPGQLTLGHFHAGKWARDDEARLAELFLGGEGLARGPDAVLGTLLHEATHGVAATRGVKDTSRQGRYHNTRFRDLATELGIAVDRDPSIGWSLTTVPDTTAETYADEITALGAALTAHRLADVHGAARTTSNNGLVATCACNPPRKIRLSRTAYETGSVLCGVCEDDFTATDPDLTHTATRQGRAAMASRDDQDTDRRAVDDLDTTKKRAKQAAVRAGIDQDALDALVASAAERRANRPDDSDRLHDRLLRDQETHRRRVAADPDAHQHNALINSQAVHPRSAHPTSGQSAPAVLGDTTRAAEPDRAAGPEDRAEQSGRETGDAALARAQVAVELLTARRRALDAHQAEQARGEQLNRWHRDDLTVGTTAESARGDHQVRRDR
jgi:hypothetical protein